MSGLTAPAADTSAGSPAGSGPALRFWMKRGCVTNTRQLGLLRAAGCAVEVRDLLAEPWTVERLAGFFGSRPVAEWFNPAAPAVKSGVLDPSSFDARAALLRLVAEPLLIRRPLLEIGSEACCGLDSAWLAARGIDLTHEPELPEGCAHGTAAQARGTKCSDEVGSA